MVEQWKDMEHFKKYMTGLDVQMEYMGEQQLLALQVQLHLLCIPK